MQTMRRHVRRERQMGRVVLAAILTFIVLLSTLVLVSSRAQAQGSVFPLPAPADSVWSIVGGYNTGSHSDTDPHAIDIVREDGPSEGTPVQAPINGTISYLSGACLTINNGGGLAVLICHFFPEPGLFRGLSVQVGDFLGTVAPAFFAENGGLPHIHLAVHQTQGSGLIQGTVPFVGAWALEGVNLPSTGTFNAHAGTRLVSSNGRGAPQPAPLSSPVPADDPGDDLGPAPDPGIDDGISLEVLRQGWNAVGWTSETDAAEVVESLGDAVTVVFTFDAEAQSFRRFSTDAPPIANNLRILGEGDGMLIYIEDSRGAILPRPPIGSPRPLVLEAGFNFTTWSGASATPDAALISLGDSLVAVFAWDAGEQRYRIHRPGFAQLSDLAEVESGQALWLQLSAPGVLDPEAGSHVDPAALLAPPADPPEEPATGDARPDVTPAEADAPTVVPADRVLLQVVGPVCLNLRLVPSTIGNTPITCLAGGVILENFGEVATDVTGRGWLKVDTVGLSGWVATEFTVPFAAARASTPVEPAVPPGDTANAVASYYHPSLAGNPMYCGSTYNPNDPSIAASTTYDCGTQLRVWRDDRFVEVVVWDTGLLPGNHIDLSEAGYNQLGLPSEGIIPVRIELIALPGA
jgi:hypothetical protein